MSGHFNALVRDHDSVVTGFGRHDRVMATIAKCGELYCRVDHVHGLGMPTNAEVLAVARKDQGNRGRWRLTSKETWNGGRCTDFHFHGGNS